jgi:hypothetical protein
MDPDRELRQSYRLVCRDIDRLLAQGRLSEARQLNDEARKLFRRLYGSSERRTQRAATRRPAVVV